MSVFTFGFNGFFQVTSAIRDGCIPSDIEPNPYAVHTGDIHCNSSASQCKILSEGESDDVNHQKKKTKCKLTDSKPKEPRIDGSLNHSLKGQLDLKDAVITWDRIIYVWKNGSVTSVGGRTATIGDKYINLFKDMTLQSLCSSWQKLFAVDVDGHCLVSDSNDRMIQLQFCGSSSQTKSSTELNSSEIFADASGCVVVISNDRRMTVWELQEKTNLIPCEINFNICVKSISCGKHHCLLLSAIGVVFSFGNGAQGQLGHGAVSSERQPKVIEALEGVRMMKVSAGGWHSMALSDIGDVYVWGWNEKGQLGLPCQKLKEKNGSNHEKSISVSVCTGSKESLSDEDKKVVDDNDAATKEEEKEEEEWINLQPLPTLLDFPPIGKVAMGTVSMPTISMETVMVVDIASGSRHSVAALEDGRAFSWGLNDYGQLGHGDKRSRDEPQLIKFFYEKQLRVTDVFAGYWNTVCITEKPDVKSLG